MAKIKTLNHDPIKTDEGNGFAVKTEEGEFLIVNESDYPTPNYNYTEVELTEKTPLYDFPEIDAYLVTKAALLEYVYLRGWNKPEDFNKNDLRKYYEGLVTHAFTK